MPSIPVDILRLILDNVDKADLLTICLLNKICCSCSQDVLYRDIIVGGSLNTRVIQTLAQSTHLAIRVRSLEITSEKELYYNPALCTSFQNMTHLRNLRLEHITGRLSFLSRCTFKLVKLSCDYFFFKPLHRFLISQPSLTDVELGILLGRGGFKCGPTILPNLTRLNTYSPLLQQLIPNRPVNEVIWKGSGLHAWRFVFREDSVDGDSMDVEDSVDFEDSMHDEGSMDDEDENGFVDENSVDYLNPETPSRLHFLISEIRATPGVDFSLANTFEFTRRSFLLDSALASFLCIE
jgi:hypothetical protein